jgi:hypothetical protein
MAFMTAEQAFKHGMQVSSKVKDAFVEEIMEVVELTPIRNSLVGLPGVPAVVLPRCQRGSLPSICHRPRICAHHLTLLRRQSRPSPQNLAFDDRAEIAIH